MNHKTVNRKGANKKQSIFPPAGGDLRQKIHFRFTIAVMVLIFVHSAMPADLSSRESGVVVAFLMEHLNEVFGRDPKMTSFIVRKSAHFLEYTLLGLSLCMTVEDFEKISGKNSAAGAAADDSAPAFFQRKCIPWLIGTAYAVTDEIHQMFVPGRSCELRDVAIDSCGVATGILLCTIIKKWKKGRPH